MINNYKKTFFIILILIIFLGMFYATAPIADAQSKGTSIGFIERQAMISVAEWFLEGLSSVFVLLANIMKGALGLSVTALTDLRSADGSVDGDAIAIAWRLIRNMVNMIFILLLVIISFATIFDTQYGAKYTLGKLLIAAVLVNFSLLIGKIVIDFSNIISASILNSFGGVDGFIDKFVYTLQLQNVYPDGDGLLDYLSFVYNRATAPQAVLNSLMFSIIFTLFAIFATLVGVAIIVARVPVLWAILIFSPLAWAAFVLPSTRKLWSLWWSKLIQWSFVLPIYLFFMYLGIYFVFNAFFTVGFEDFINSYNVGENTGFLNNFFTNFKLLFTFILSSIFMLGGGFFAAKLSGDAGKFTSNVQGYLEKQVRGRLSDYTGAGTAWKQFKETGRIGNTQTPYGGEQSRRLRKARGDNIFQPGALVKQQEAEVNRERQSLEAKRLTMKEDDFRKELANAQGSDPRAMAAKLMLAEQGVASYKDDDGNVQTRDMTKSDVVGFLKQAEGDRTPLGQQFIQNLEKSQVLNKLDSREKMSILRGDDDDTLDYVNLRKAIGKNMANGKAEAPIEVAEPLLQLMTPGEKDEWIEKTKWEKAAGGIDNSDSSNAAVAQLKSLRTSGKVDNSVVEKIEKKLEEFNPAIIAEAAGKNVKDVLGDKLKSDPEKIAKYLGNVVKTHSNETREALGGFSSDEFGEIIKKANKETLDAVSQLGFNTKSRNKNNSKP